MKIMQGMLLALILLANSQAEARFLTPDSVKPDPNSGQNFNRYWYADNNPVKNVDPDGRNPVTGAAVGCAVSGPACPAGALAGAIIGTAIGVATVLVYNEIVEDAADLPTGDDINIDDKIKGQIGDRGWTEEGVREITKTEPSGTTIDNTKGKIGDKGEPATVYGSKDGDYVVVNDKSGEVVQVSNKNNPEWKPDRRIDWKEDK